MLLISVGNEVDFVSFASVLLFVFLSLVLVCNLVDIVSATLGDDEVRFSAVPFLLSDDNIVVDCFLSPCKLVR